jgi:hypothetical protein
MATFMIWGKFFSFFPWPSSNLLYNMLLFGGIRQWVPNIRQNRIFGIGNAAKYSVLAEVVNPGFGRSLVEIPHSIRESFEQPISSALGGSGCSSIWRRLKSDEWRQKERKNCSYKKWFRVTKSIKPGSNGSWCSEVIIQLAESKTNLEN